MNLHIALLASLVEQQQETISKLERRLRKLETTTGGYWTTASGYRLQVRDMSDSLLRNARAYLEKDGFAPNEDLEREAARREEDQYRAERIEPFGVPKMREAASKLAGARMTIIVDGEEVFDGEVVAQ